MPVSFRWSTRNIVVCAGRGRGLLLWLRIAQAWAMVQGRRFVTANDVQAVALPVLEVRLGLGNADPADLVAEILDTTTVRVYPAMNGAGIW